MNIDLTREEIAKILKEKFGEASFRVFYTQSDKCWEGENNQEIHNRSRSKETWQGICCLYFNKC